MSCGGPVIVCLHHPIDKDATLKELADLPLGWWAERTAPGEPWVRRKHEPAEKEERESDLHTTGSPCTSTSLASMPTGSGFGRRPVQLAQPQKIAVAELSTPATAPMSRGL